MQESVVSCESIAISDNDEIRTRVTEPCRVRDKRPILPGDKCEFNISHVAWKTGTTSLVDVVYLFDWFIAVCVFYCALIPS
jgi:hypothetical protein